MISKKRSLIIFIIFTLILSNINIISASEFEEFSIKDLEKELRQINKTSGYNIKANINIYRKYYESKSNLGKEEILAYKYSSKDLDNKLVEEKLNIRNGSNVSSLVNNILGLMAIGKDPSNYNNTDYIQELKNIQAENGGFKGEGEETSLKNQVDAVLALETAKEIYNRDRAIGNILSYEKENGGYGGAEETGLAVLGLSNFSDRKEVKESIFRSIRYLLEEQDNVSGGYKNDEGEEDLHAVASVIQGLISIGENPLAGEWRRNGNSMINSLIGFYDTNYYKNLSEEEKQDLISEIFVSLVYIENKQSTYKLLGADLGEESINTIDNNINFKDLKDYEWAEESIYHMVDKNIITGKSNTRFAPNENITRAEFSALLSRLLDLEVNDKELFPFYDVKMNKWYYDVVRSVYGKGYVTGKGNNRFAPEDNITREEITTIIGKVLVNHNIVLEDENILSSINDSGKISNWAIEGTKLSLDKNIIKGFEGNFKPKDKANRAEVAVIIDRLYKLLEEY